MNQYVSFSCKIKVFVHVEPFRERFVIFMMTFDSQKVSSWGYQVPLNLVNDPGPILSTSVLTLKL